MYINGTDGWKSFGLLDSGDGYRLERWGDFTLARPDPQVIWEKSHPELWERADATFRNDTWEGKPLPESWELTFEDLSFVVRPTNFKHTGIFPEQAANWVWMRERLNGLERPSVMNLFAYTGAASMVLAKAGVFVTHVDASRPALNWAKENQEKNGLPADSVRWMLEDAAKFVKKEVRRGEKYQGIVLDPPAFGHGPSGSVWKFNRDVPSMLRDCANMLSDDAKFLLVNAYATNSSPLALRYVLEDVVRTRGGSVEEGELCLGQKDGRLVSVGIFARWTSK